MNTQSKPRERAFLTLAALAGAAAVATVATLVWRGYLADDVAGTPAGTDVPGVAVAGVLFWALFIATVALAGMAVTILVRSRR